MLYLILAAVLLTGCKHAPSNFARRIARADRIVIIYRFPHGPPPLSSFSLSVTGGKVHEIVHAISSAKRLGVAPVTLSIWEWELRFYSGTNLLATVDFQGDVFLVENSEYYDDSGMLAGLDREIYRLIHFSSNTIPANPCQATNFNYLLSQTNTTTQTNALISQ